MNTSAPNVEPLWRQIAVPVIAGILLGAASSLIGIFKLALSSIADPYTSNIYWEPCLQQPFSLANKCFFTAYRVVNNSSQPTESPIKFDFAVYKPVDANLVPTYLSRKYRGKRTFSVDAMEAPKLIMLSSSEVDTEFEVYMDNVNLWMLDQSSEGWHRVIATLPDSIPAGKAVDIVTIYCSYPPIQIVQLGLNPLTIKDVPYPDAERYKQAITQQKQTLISYWILFLVLVAATVVTCTWAIRKYTQYRSKLTYIQETLEKARQKDEEEQRRLRDQQKEESKLDEEFKLPEEDEEAMDIGKKESSENQDTPKPDESEDKNKTVKKKAVKKRKSRKKKNE